jgi:hypothetical protein
MPQLNLNFHDIPIPDNYRGSPRSPVSTQLLFRCRFAGARGVAALAARPLATLAPHRTLPGPAAFGDGGLEGPALSRSVYQ